MPHSDPGAPVARSAGLLVAVLVVVGVLAGAAFGLGATRRMRATGLLAANGADDGHLVTAAASEALVVALPAAVLGVVVAWAARGPWIRLRLPGWSSLVDATLPWPWALAVVAAAVASTVGAVAFSRPMPDDLRRCSTATSVDWGCVGAVSAATALVGMGARAFCGGWPAALGVHPGDARRTVVLPVVGLGSGQHRGPGWPGGPHPLGRLVAQTFGVDGSRRPPVMVVAMGLHRRGRYRHRLGPSW